MAGDLDRGATQLSGIKQGWGGVGGSTLFKITSSAISLETSELLHPKKKSGFPGQHHAANFKQMCSNWSEVYMMKAFLRQAYSGS